MNQRLRRSPPDVVYTPIDVTSWEKELPYAGHNGRRADVVLTSDLGIKIIVEVKYSNGKGINYGFDLARAGHWLAVELNVASKAGKLGDVGKSYRPLTDVEMELARTKKELAEVKMERDILKKAAAYFARESLPGTR